MTEEQKSPRRDTYPDYFNLNRTIMSVLSLFAGFLFTSITLLVAWFPNRTEFASQVTILFMALIFYMSLYVLLDNLEMGFHYIDKIPPMTLKVRPFLWLLVIFYLFGTATILLFLLYGLVVLSVVSGTIWAMIVFISLWTTGRRFYEQSVARDWSEKD